MLVVGSFEELGFISYGSIVRFGPYCVLFDRVFVIGRLFILKSEFAADDLPPSASETDEASTRHAAQVSRANSTILYKLRGNKEPRANEPRTPPSGTSASGRKDRRKIACWTPLAS